MFIDKNCHLQSYICRRHFAFSHLGIKPYNSTKYYHTIYNSSKKKNLKLFPFPILSCKLKIQFKKFPLSELVCRIGLFHRITKLIKCSLLYFSTFYATNDYAENKGSPINDVMLSQREGVMVSTNA